MEAGRLDVLGERGVRAEPNFDIDFAVGAQTEAWVADVLRPALESQRVETKMDRGFVDTGNIYVERSCRYPSGWKPTGIDNPGTASLWLYDLSHSGVAIVFEVDTLRRLAADPRVSRDAKCVVGDHPTTGSLINLRKAFTPGILEARW